MERSDPLLGRMLKSTRSDTKAPLLTHSLVAMEQSPSLAGHLIWWPKPACGNGVELEFPACVTA